MDHFNVGQVRKDLLDRLILGQRFDHHGQWFGPDFVKVWQEEAAEITGGGPNAFSRYERGTAKPLAAVINLFRLLEKHPELLEELKGAR